jgi:hypothetical protein
MEMQIRHFSHTVGLLTCLLTSGCTSVILVDPAEPLDNDRVFNYDQVNARLTGESATITTTAGRVFDCYFSEVGRDSTHFFERLSYERGQISTREVLKVEYINHGAGAFTGGIVGTLGGIGVGIGIMLAASDGSSDSRMGAAVAFLGAMAGGAVLGGVAGYLEGSTQEYRFKVLDPVGRPHGSIPEAGAP